MVNNVTKDEIVSNNNKHIIHLLRKNVPIDLLSMIKSVKNLDEQKVEPPQVVMAKHLIANGREANTSIILEYIFTSLVVKQGETMYWPVELARICGLEVNPLYFTEYQVMSQIGDLLVILGEVDIYKTND
ncbi:hypothetical protein K493DRAFT_298985 [Basidiobolus meristosporus CBS 931.73]|uniref:DNA-directed DNA polymerase n=1 Tax=Basidiobolus meristosporus CBS 931.73 TaxID=1314790 RepID=A0A1Y1YQ97_9FUNG|nr:hypothetical protein K493DRAFT_298985 [Basidiobolus meristosporus CBS 931.73]|eukprot:ORY00202.1 hypothetical protein K493DRAFT_298985 [Basidiobolus meristosporus CBS 931.73]